MLQVATLYNHNFTFSHCLVKGNVAAGNYTCFSFTSSLQLNLNFVNKKSFPRRCYYTGNDIYKMKVKK